MLIQNNSSQNVVDEVYSYDAKDASLFLVRNVEYPIFQDASMANDFTNALHNAIIHVSQYDESSNMKVILWIYKAKDGDQIREKYAIGILSEDLLRHITFPLSEKSTLSH